MKQKIYFLCALLFSIASFAQTFNFSGITYSITSTNPPEIKVEGQVAVATGTLPVEISIPTSAIYNGLAYTVTSIEHEAFQLSELTKVTLPNTITTIGIRAFSQCYSLNTINIPEKTTVINFEAFNQCYSLTTMNISENVTLIRDRAFYKCGALTDVSFPNSSLTIGLSAFEYCDRLQTINFGSSVTNIGSNAFKSCIALRNLKIPKSVTSIGNGAFENCNLSLVEVDWAAPLAINATVFQDGLNGITSTLIVPQGKKSTYEAAAGWNAFQTIRDRVDVGQRIKIDGINYSFTNVTAPLTVTVNNDNRLFTGNAVIPDSIVHQGIDYQVTSISDGAFAGGAVQSISIGGSSLKTINNNAFNNCLALTHISLGAQVDNIGSKAFSNCLSLRSVNVNWAIPLTIDATVFQNVNLKNVQLNVPRGKANLYGTAAVWSTFNPIVAPPTVGEVFIANGINYIVTKDTTPYEVAVGNNLSFIGAANIPASFTYHGFGFAVTSTSASAFNSASNLTAVTIPDSVTSFGSNAFANCSNLKSVSINWPTPLAINTTIFQNVNLNNVQLNVPKGKAHLYRAAAVWGNFNPIAAPPTVNETLTVNGINYIVTKDTTPYEVAVYNNSSFSGAANIPASLSYTGFTFGVTSINASAFSGASGLTTATIPNTVTNIPNNVFSNCTSLTSITIPASVRSIGSAAFTNCSRLTAVSIPNSVTSVANDLFSGCSALTTVAIPESVTSIGNNSFSNCNGLTSVTIPASVTSIGSGAFTNCTRLSSITIPIMVNSIGQNAFSGCTGLTAFTVNWTTPLVINPNVFQFINLSNVALHVPSRTSALYEANTVWTNFNIVKPPSPPATHLNFDGVDDAVILPTSIGTALSSGTEFTIEYWYKGNNLQSGVRFQQNGAYIVAGLATSGDPVFAISTDNNPTSITCGPAYTINDDTWHHLAFVWKQNERFSTYLDGEVQSETGDVIVLLPYFENVNGSIGAWLEGNTEFLAGNIDDVRIWNVARSGSEIARDRFCELLGYEAGLLAYYKFNQGSDADSNTDVTALTDASSNNNHATLSSGFALIGTNSNFLEGSIITTGSIVPSPPAISSRLFNMAATVANLPSTVRWYYDAFGGTALPSNTLLETRSYYAAAVNSSGCESARTEVPVTIYQVTLGETITISGVNYVVTKDTVPYEVEVGDNRFYSNESELFIPPSIYYNGLDFAVTSIVNSAFYYVLGLNAVTIPASVSSIGQGAFTYCSALTTVTVNWPTPLIIDTFIFGGLDLKTVQLYVPFGKEALYADAEVWRDFKFPAPALGATFTVNGINYKVTKATLPYEVEVGINGDTTKYDSVAGNFAGAANIPASVKNLGNEFEVTSIGEIAFLDCNNLTSVSIPNSVRSIGDSAFLGCSGLTSLILPSSVTTIGPSAFVFCIMLTSVTIPNSVTSIGQNAFGICTGLTAVNVNWTTPLPIAANVFASVTLSNVTLNAPADKVTLYQAADVWKNFNIKLPVPATHLNFDGIDDYVVLPLNKTLIPSSNFTHEFWFQTTDSNGTLFTASTGAYSNPSGWDRSIFMDNGKVSTHLWTGAVNKLTTTASYNDGSWHHVAHVVNATGSYLYLDGLLAGSNAVTASAFTSNTEITLGVSPLAGGSYFNGNIDDVRIWNVSKTASEIARSKNCELLGNETGLVAYYKFNQGYDAESNSTLTTVTNTTANANHGTLTGFGLAGNTSNFSAGSIVTSGLTLPNAPIATPISFCGASTVANLSPAPSPTINWYNVATGGTLLPGLTPISTSGTYYVAALNSNGCESARTSVAVTVNTTAAPMASDQSFCNAATVASLTATGTNLKWYDAATAGTLLNSSTALATGNYYVSQTLNACESARKSVAVIVNTTVAPMASDQSFCNAATVASLTATGTNLKWYNAATAGTLLNASTALATGTYFVSQTLNTCESARTSVAVTINTTAAPTASAQSFTTASTVANLVPAPSSTLKWYNVLTGGVALSINTPLATGNYYLAATNSNGCESARTTIAVAVNVVILPQVGDTFTANDINYIVTKATTPYEVSVNTNTSFVGAAVIPQTVANTGNTFHVTSFIELAFGGCTGLTSVSIPATITSIANGTFQGCTNLLSVTIPNSVTDLGDYSFSYCTALESITIPNSVTRINTQAFFACTSLINIVIPNSVTSIDSHAFIACTSLSSITIPNSVSSIGESAFESCSALTTITLPNALTSISTKLFSSCVALTSVLIPNSVTSIGDFAFEGCTALPSLTLPNSIISIGESAFTQCESLASILLSNTLLTIGDNAFSSSGLVSVTMPNSVTQIGIDAFAGCSKMESVVISNSLTSINDGVFRSCPRLASVTIPASVTRINFSAFDRCTGLTSVVIPNSVTTIGNRAFSRCTSLTSINIPNSVTSIEHTAFSFCTGLTSVTVNWLNPLVIDASIFFNVTLSNVTLNVPSGTKAAYQAAVIWKDFNPITAPDSNIIPSTMSFCAGTRVAAAVGTSTLKFYSALTGGSVLAGTTTLVTRTYFATQLVNGIESTPRVAVAITINPLPATPAIITGTAIQGVLVGTTTTATYSIVAVTGAPSYVWTAPTGVNIVSGQGTNTITVNFANVPAGVGAIGNLSVVAVNSNDCRSSIRNLALTKALPAAPTAIKMTDDLLTIPLSGILTAVTSFAQYMGTSRVLTLTATPSLTATSYEWELPAGVNQLSGGTTNVITVNFAGVTSGNTYNFTTTATVPVSTNVLRIGVKAKNGTGVSVTANTLAVDPTTISTARLLTLKAVLPAAPSAIRMTDALATDPLRAVTVISNFIRTAKVFTLTATPSALASSYAWELPAGVTQLSGGNTNTITVNFANVAAGTTSLYLGVKAVNGIGTSVTATNGALVPATTSTAKLLKLTATVPAAVTAVTGQMAGLCGSTTYSYTITPTALATAYSITAPTGAVVKSANSMANSTNSLTTSDLIFTVTYPAGFVATTAAPKTLAVASVNGVGSSTTSRSLNLSTLMPAFTTVTGSAGITTFTRNATQTFTVADVVGATTYNWTVANGAMIVSGQGTNTIAVNFAAVPVATTTTKVTVAAANACGVSNAVRTLSLTVATPTTARLAPEAMAINTTEVYPNPIVRNFNIDVTATKVGVLELSIYTMDGVLIRKPKVLKLKVGDNSLTKNVADFPTGVYILQLVNTESNQVTTKRLIKK